MAGAGGCQYQAPPARHTSRRLGGRLPGCPLEVTGNAWASVPGAGGHTPLQWGHRVPGQTWRIKCGRTKALWEIHSSFVTSGVSHVALTWGWHGSQHSDHNVTFAPSRGPAWPAPLPLNPDCSHSLHRSGSPPPTLTCGCLPGAPRAWPSSPGHWRGGPGPILTPGGRLPWWAALPVRASMFGHCPQDTASGLALQWHLPSQGRAARSFPPPLQWTGSDV